MIEYIIALGLCAGFSAIAVWFYLRIASRKEIFDHANARSMHREIVPRGGGIAFVLVAVVTSFIAWYRIGITPLYALIFASLLLLIIGALDDIRRGPNVDGLPASIRIMTHAIGALIVVLAYGAGSNLWLVLMGIAIVWWINLTNFMDGIDGIAGGFAVVIHGFLSYWSYSDGDWAWFIFNSAMAASVIGFLLFNWSPAKVFMGDSGSTVLGLTMAIAGLKGSEGIAEVMPFALVSLPFWFDATITLIHRLIKGERIFEAHRSHLYQRIVVHHTNPNGLSVRTVSSIYILLSFILGLIASIIR